MKGINTVRWLAGGVAAGILIWLMEGAASMFYMADMQAAMEAHRLSMELTAGAFVISVVVSLIVGLVLVFFYAASRPRFGAGPRTAIIVAVALWFGSMLVSILGYQMLGLFPVGMLVTWSLIGLIEWILAALLGAWIYREGEA